MHGHALPASDVTDDLFAPDRIAAASAIDHQVVVTFDDECRVGGIAAENASHHASESTFFLLIFEAGGRVFRRGTVGGKTAEHLARRILAVTDSGDEIFVTTQTVVLGYAVEGRFGDVFQRNAVLPRLFFDQLVADFNGALALVNVEPVLDLLACARGLRDGEPVTAGMMSRLRDDLDNVTRMQA